MTDQPVILYDTTLRDGTQGENITLSLADKLRVARMLDEYGFPFIEGGWPGSNPKDIEFFAAARKLTWQTRAAGGVRQHPPQGRTGPEADPNLRELVAAETPVVTIFGKSWLLHVTEVLGATPAQNLDMIADSIGFIVDHGREAVYDAEHFFDGYRADRDYALATLRAARDAGARTLVLCDTNGGTLTDELVRILGDVRASLEADPDAGPVTWGIHTHNDAELAVANSIAAVQAGVRHVQATINGYGERCGNANMVSILANLALKTGNRLAPAGGGDLAALTALSRSVAEIANQIPNDYQPYVGRSAFAHKGGVHGAAVAKVERSYQHVDPTAVGNAGRLVVCELGGKANTSIRARQLGHELEGVLDARELSQLIKRLENEGLAFEGAEASFELLIRRNSPGYAAPFRDRGLHLPRGAALGPRAPRRGHGQGGGRRRDPAHRRRRQRPGQRARRRAAQGARRVLPGPGRRAPGGLQGAHPRRGDRDGGAHPRHHRLPGRHADLEHDGQRHQHHRGVRAGPGGLARVRDLEVRRRGGAARRAPLHDDERGAGGGSETEVVSGEAAPDRRSASTAGRSRPAPT